MTTTITIKTHDWPASVTTESSIDHSTPQTQVDGYTRTTQFVAKHTEFMATLSAGATVLVEELPQDATGLYDAEADATMPEVIDDKVPNGFTLDDQRV